MAERMTESRVLLNRKDEQEFMRKWCEYAAERGGRFAIMQEWCERDWYTFFTIWWPDGLDGPTAATEGRQ